MSGNNDLEQTAGAFGISVILIFVIGAFFFFFYNFYPVFILVGGLVTGLTLRSIYKKDGESKLEQNKAALMGFFIGAGAVVLLLLISYG
jgi:hypothetical protein